MRIVEPESTTETGRMIINNVYTLSGQKCIENTLLVCDIWWINCSNLRQGFHSQPPAWECDYITDCSSETKNIIFFSGLHHHCPDEEMMPCKQPPLNSFLITHNHTTHKLLLISLCSKIYENVHCKGCFKHLPLKS